MKNFHHKIKHKVKEDPKKYLIIFLAFIIIIIAYFWFSGNAVSVAIEDKCGRMVNLFQHTINTEESCKLRCASQCESLQKSYKRVEFVLSTVGCNKCQCYCK